MKAVLYGCVVLLLLAAIYLADLAAGTFWAAPYAALVVVVLLVFDAFGHRADHPARRPRRAQTERRHL